MGAQLCMGRKQFKKAVQIWFRRIMEIEGPLQGGAKNNELGNYFQGKQLGPNQETFPTRR